MKKAQEFTLMEKQIDQPSTSSPYCELIPVLVKTTLGLMALQQSRQATTWKAAKPKLVQFYKAAVLLELASP